jgi:putative spermidine/putrescine transport system ATP-binding protein
VSGDPQGVGSHQQRLALARALITEPRVLPLDEPFSALDPFLRTRVREELKRLQQELGITFTHVTHSQDEAMALADLMVVMEDGHIRQAGLPREIFERRVSAFVARFTGGHKILRGANGAIAVRADRCRLGGERLLCPAQRCATRAPWPGIPPRSRPTSGGR